MISLTDNDKYAGYSDKGKISTILLVKTLLDKNLVVKGDLSKFYEYNKATDTKYEPSRQNCLDGLERKYIDEFK